VLAGDIYERQERPMLLTSKNIAKRAQIRQPLITADTIIGNIVHLST